MHGLMEASWPKKLLTEHPGVLQPNRNRLPSTFGQFESDWLLRFTLQDGSALLDLACCKYVCHFEPNEITSAQLAIDGGVEQYEISVVLGNFKSDSDGANMLRHQWSLLSDQMTLVPRWPLWANGG